MNQFTKIVIPIYFWSIHLLLLYLHPNIFVIRYLSWMIEVWMKNHLVSDKNHSIANLQCPMATNVRFTFSVRDTTQTAYN